MAGRIASRARLLAAAVEQAMWGGIADLHRRELTVAIGTSRSILRYYFAFREGLLVAVSIAVEEAQRAAVPGWRITTADAWRGRAGSTSAVAIQPD